MTFEEYRLLRNEYQRNWRNKNKDKVKKINKRFYQKQREKKLEEENKQDEIK